MSQTPPAPGTDDEAVPVDEVSGSADTVGLTRTGVVEVDAVLERVEGVENLPVDEHVAVFESAQSDLRRALDDAGSE